MPGLLLDTHALYWLVSGDEDLSASALLAIRASQIDGALFVSPVTAWELAVATQKRRVAGRPNLGGDSAGRWFGDAVRASGARIIPIKQRISCEAANVVIDTGHKDPGDCFLMATARIQHIPLVTRDGSVLALAAQRPDYLSVIAC